MDDLFLKIIRGEIPSHKVYEDEHTFAFLDIKPVGPGHTLVVPKTQSRNILEIPENEWLQLTKSVRIISRAIKEALNADGVNIIMNNEPAGHQVIFHSHVHIIPRFEGDGIKPWPQGEYKEGEVEEVAEKIRGAL